MDENGVKLYDGDYTYFTEKFNRAEKNTTSAEKKESAAALSYKERKRIESENRKRQTKIKRAEESIAELEENIEKLTSELQTPEIATDYEKAMELSNKISELNAELEDKYALWEELQSEQEKNK